jgi:hypothetical protein
MMNNISYRAPYADIDSMEQITPNLKLEWLFGRRAFAMTVGNGARTTIDAWFDRVRTIRLGWPAADRPLLGLYDLTYDTIALSPYVRAHSEALRNLRPEVDFRVALVLRSPLSAQIGQLFVRMNSRPNLVVRTFGSRDDALDWLRRELKVTFDTTPRLL